jgi:hypothetical protein
MAGGGKLTIDTANVISTTPTPRCMRRWCRGPTCRSR